MEPPRKTGTVFYGSFAFFAPLRSKINRKGTKTAKDPMGKEQNPASPNGGIDRIMHVSLVRKQEEFMAEEKQKEEVIELPGVVIEEVRGAFRVKLDGMEHIVLCRLAGKMRKFRIRVVPGDHVTVEVSPYDMARGRIIYRDK
jgi:translation initiation factor IF-1